MLKRILAALPLILGLSLSAHAADTAQAAEDAPAAAKPKKILVAYFSHSGNTRDLANKIHASAGGDLFEIKTVQQYPEDYDTVVKQAKEELNAGFRPPLATTVENMESYDVIFLGFPNWCGTIPMGLFTFLEQYDLSGKTVIPFCTHEGSRFGNSLEDIKKLCPKSEIKEGLAVRGRRVKKSDDDVATWLRKLEFIK